MITESKDKVEAPRCRACGSFVVGDPPTFLASQCRFCNSEPTPIKKTVKNLNTTCNRTLEVKNIEGE